MLYMQNILIFKFLNKIIIFELDENSKIIRFAIFLHDILLGEHKWSSKSQKKL